MTKPLPPKQSPPMLRVILDASCDPDEAAEIRAAIQRLRGVKHVEQLVGLNAALDVSVDLLELTTRPRNALERAKILTIGDLIARSRFELRRLKNLGKHGLAEIEKRLTAAGLRLRPQTGGEFAAAVIAERRRNDERRAEFLKEFKVTRTALGALYDVRRARQGDYSEWDAWSRVVEGLHTYVQRAAESVGIELRYEDLQVQAAPAESVT